MVYQSVLVVQGVSEPMPSERISAELIRGIRRMVRLAVAHSEGLTVGEAYVRLRFGYRSRKSWLTPFPVLNAARVVEVLVVWLEGGIPNE